MCLPVCRIEATLTDRHIHHHHQPLCWPATDWSVRCARLTPTHEPNRDADARNVHLAPFRQMTSRLRATRRRSSSMRSSRRTTSSREWWSVCTVRRGFCAERGETGHLTSTRTRWQLRDEPRARNCARVCAAAGRAALRRRQGPGDPEGHARAVLLIQGQPQHHSCAFLVLNEFKKMLKKN